MKAKNLRSRGPVPAGPYPGSSPHKAVGQLLKAIKAATKVLVKSSDIDDIKEAHRNVTDVLSQYEFLRTDEESMIKLEDYQARLEAKLSDLEKLPLSVDEKEKRKISLDTYVKDIINALNVASEDNQIPVTPFNSKTVGTRFQIKSEPDMELPQSNDDVFPSPYRRVYKANDFVHSLLQQSREIRDLVNKERPREEILSALRDYADMRENLNSSPASSSLSTRIQDIDRSLYDYLQNHGFDVTDEQTPTTEEPTTQQPTTQQPMTQQPMTQQPTTQNIDVQTQPVAQDTEMLAQQGQLQMPPAVPDVTGEQPSMPTDDRSVSQHVFVQESTHNQSYLDDSQLLANISSNYDSLNRPALAALGADISYRRERPVDTTNSFRESLYGPRVSGGDIRQLNRVADTDLIPLQQNVNIKLTQLRNDLVSFLDSFIEDPEPTSSDEYTRRPSDTYEYDPMEVQIPIDRESLLQQQAEATTNAQDDAVNPQAFSRSVLVPEEVDATFKMVQRGSGNYIVKKLRSAGLKNLVKPYSDYFSSVYDYMSVPTEDRLLVVKSSIQRMRLSMQSYQQKVGPYVFQGIGLSCAVTESAIDGLLYNSSQKQRALYQIKQYDAQMRQGVAPSKKSYAPY